MLPGSANPWFIDGRLVGFWLIVKVFPNGAIRYRYKLLPELCREDFVNWPEGADNIVG